MPWVEMKTGERKIQMGICRKCLLKKECILLGLALGLLMQVGAQELTDAEGNIIGGEGSNLPIPKQDKIPIVGYIIPDCYLYVPQYHIASSLERETYHGQQLYVMRENDGCWITVSHDNALSSKSMSEFVDSLLDSYGKIYGEGAGLGGISKDIGKMEATVEITEFVTKQARLHVVHRLFRTVDGFASVNAYLDAKKWTDCGAPLCVYLKTCRLATSTELEVAGRRGLVCVDAEGDYFVRIPKHIILDEMMRQGRKGTKLSERDYFRNATKNASVDSVCENDPKLQVEPLIKEIFGVRVGEDLTDASKVRRVSGGEMHEQRTRKFKSPFDVFKGISIYYTARGMTAYRVVLESKEYRDADFKKMENRLKQISEAIETKFGDRLKMEKKESGYVAKFRFTTKQTLCVNIRTRTEKKSGGLVKVNYSKFKLEFVDSGIAECE